MSRGGWVDIVCFRLETLAGSSKLQRNFHVTGQERHVITSRTHLAAAAAARAPLSSLIDARSAVSTHLNYVIDI